MRGIYSINIDNIPVYIGQSKRIEERLKQHKAGIEYENELKYRILRRVQDRVSFSVLYQAKAYEDLLKLEREYMLKIPCLLNTVGKWRISVDWSKELIDIYNEEVVVEVEAPPKKPVIKYRKIMKEGFVPFAGRNLLQLEVGRTYKMKELAEWFCITYSTIRKEKYKERRYEELKLYADYTREGNNVTIVKIKCPYYVPTEDRELMDFIMNNIKFCAEEPYTKQAERYMQENPSITLMRDTLAQKISQLSKEVYDEVIIGSEDADEVRD